MMIAVVFALLALLLTVGLFAASRSQNKPIASLDDLQSRLSPIDLPALLNLVDSREEQFLRENLPPRDFNSIRRKRLGVTWEYLSRLSSNAKLLVQAGQIIQHSSRGSQAREASVLVADSIQLRNLVFAAKVSTAMKFVFPGTASPIASLLERYAQSRNSLEHAFAQRRIHAVVRPS
jgi:hypothetical protein